MFSIFYHIAQRFHAAGYPVYIVGGSVRNPLLHLPASDLDVCGPATPEQVIRLFSGSDVNVVPRAVEFGTVELHFMAEGTRWCAEYTTFRCDSYRQGHRPESVHFTTDISLDARRRDFRVNAIYQDAYTGEIVDPTSGIFDLAAHRLCTVTDDPTLVIRDDGLRIMRMLRFASQLSFDIEETLWHCAVHYVPMLNDIARERLREEFEKLMLSDLRYPQLNLKFQNSAYGGLCALRSLNILPILFGDLRCDENLVYTCVDQLSTNAEYTKAVITDSRLKFVEKPDILALRLSLYLHENPPEAVKNALIFLRFSTSIVKKTVDFVDKFQSFVDKCNDSAAVAAITDEQAHAIILFLAASGKMDRASALSHTLDALNKQNAPRTLRDLPITGEDVLPLLGDRPRSLMSPLLNAAFEYAVSHPQNRSREDLLAFLRNALLNA